MKLARCLLPASLITLLTLTATVQSVDPSARLELEWRQHWKNYARRVIKLDDAFYACALYESQYPSSRGVTTIMLRQKTAKEITERFGTNAKVRRVINRPNEEIEAAASALPDIMVGQYGLVHSVEILDVLGPDEMIVGSMWLVDSEAVQKERDKDEAKIAAAGIDRREAEAVLDWMYEAREALGKKQREREYRGPFKVKGFSTIGLAKGDRWQGKEGKGIDFAIVGEAMHKTSKFSRREEAIPLLIPADAFKRNLADEKEFLAYLESRKFTKEMFLTLVNEEKKQNPKDDRLADSLIFQKLEGLDKKDEDEKK